MSDLVERLYRDHGPELVAALALSTDDPYLAEGMAHETFLRAQAAQEELASHPAPRTWLLRTAYELIRGRHLTPRPRHTTAEEHPVLGSPGLVAADPLFLRLQELPPSQRDIAVLHGLLGLPIAETVSVVGTSPAEVETSFAAGSSVLGPMETDRTTLSQLIRTAHPVHSERLEDLDYVELGERSVLSYLVGIAAVLLFAGWLVARFGGGSPETPVATQPPPTSSPTQTPTLIARAPAASAPGAALASDTSVEPLEDTGCVGCSIDDGVDIPPPRIVRAPSKSAGYVLHIRANHTWLTPRNKQYASLQTELWLDPGNGDARYIETEPETRARTIHVRKGNLYILLAPPENEITTRSLLDASDPYAGPPQDQLFKYKPLLDRGPIMGARRVRFEGRKALMFVTGTYRYGLYVTHVWIDRNTGMLLQEVNHWVNIDNEPVEIGRHHVKYTLIERVSRQKLPEGTFTLIQSRAQSTGGSQPGSPLAIPPDKLQDLGLHLSGEFPDPEIAILLRKHKGERLFSNLWGIEPRAPDSAVTGVLDERYSFPTRREARAFLNGGALDTVDDRVPGFEGKPRSLKRGSRTLLYKQGNHPTDPGQMMYLYAFQVENIVTRVGVAGSSRLSPQEAASLAWAAEARVRETLGK